MYHLIFIWWRTPGGMRTFYCKKILDAVSSHFKTYKSPEASFTYQVENAEGKVLSTKKGSVKMKGNKYKVTMDGTEIYSDGKTVWNYDKSTNEVTVDNINSSGTAMTPQKMFTNFYDKDFLYKKKKIVPSVFNSLLIIIYEKGQLSFHLT